jgi:hypothetical protein
MKTMRGEVFPIFQLPAPALSIQSARPHGYAHDSQPQPEEEALLL